MNSIVYRWQAQVTRTVYEIVIDPKNPAQGVVVGIVDPKGHEHQRAEIGDPVVLARGDLSPGELVVCSEEWWSHEEEGGV